AEDATLGDVTRYCGTFAGEDQGTWTLQVAGARASGAFQGAYGGGVLLGDASAGALELVSPIGSAQGTFSAASVAGSWSSADPSDPSRRRHGSFAGDVR